MEGFLYDVAQGRLFGRGITYGYGDASIPRVVKLGKRHVVGRIPSRSDWGSVGLSATNPAEWFLWRVEWHGETTLRVLEVIEELQPGRRWQKAKRELLEAFTRLESS